MTSLGQMPRDLPDSPAGRQLRWYLGLLLTVGEDAAAAEPHRLTPQIAKRFRPARDEDERTSFGSRMGAITEVAVEVKSDFRIDTLIATTKGRRWRISLAVEEQPPNRIAELNWEQQYDFKIEVREATEADAATLADLELRCPVELDDKSVYFDRRKDYFAFARLMEEKTIGIVFVDSAPAAEICWALHHVRVGGVVRPVMTGIHLRVLPEHQRKGLWGAANRVLNRYRDKVDATCAYVSVENTAMQHGFVNTPDKWSIDALRAQLSCADLSGPAAGRAATVADAARIVEMLNAFHDREELYLPYSVESLMARLERAPNQYSWDKLWMTERAVVGVWPSGQSVKLVIESNGKRVESRRALVLDYCFEPGAEAEFESLLRAWCRWLAERGMDSLSIFTSASSPGYERLRSLAGELEAYNLWTPGLAEPSGANERGLYVDPIYF